MKNIQNKNIFSLIMIMIKSILESFNIDPRFLYAKLSQINTFSHPNRYNDLIQFCLFIGHGRSGSTMIGSLLNAHPNIVISNELDSLKYLDDGLSQTQLFNLILFVAKRSALFGSLGGGGYSYSVPNQWQGRYNKLLVIGDRKAGATSIRLSKDRYAIQKLKACINKNIKFIFVIRNPFDTISTTFLKTYRQQGESSENHLAREIDNYFYRCSSIFKVTKKFGHRNLLYFYYEDFLSNPKSKLQYACNFLNVKTSDIYLHDCAKIVKKKPHKSRLSVNWHIDQINSVQNRFKDFPWLKRYSYNS